VKRPPLEAPRLILGVTSLALPVRATRDRQLEIASRFEESESLAVALVKGVGAGAEAILAPPTQDIRDALAELPKPLPILARVPHLWPADDLLWEPALFHDPNEEANGKRAGSAAMNLLPLSMSSDLAARVLPRIEREAATFHAKALRGIVVSSVATDLALAANQAKFIEKVVRFARGKRWLVGFETRNLGHLIQRLGAWGATPDFVIGAVNPRGVGMMPDQASVLVALRSTPVKVIATELRAGGMVALSEGAAWARHHGAWGLCAELVDMDDVPKELKSLVVRPAA
jgi:hypothetical protein